MKPMHKRYNSRSKLYHVCASVFTHFSMQRKNNLNIPYNIITNKNTFAKKMPFYIEKFIPTSRKRCNVARMYL